MAKKLPKFCRHTRRHMAIYGCGDRLQAAHGSEAEGPELTVCLRLLQLPPLGPIGRHLGRT